MNTAHALPAPPAAFNLAQYVFHHIKKDPAKIALVVAGKGDERRFDYGAIESAVLGVATGLHGLGLRHGARVLLRMGNTHHFPLAYLGAIAGGYVPVVSSPMLNAAECNRVAQVTAPVVMIQAPNVAGPKDMSLPALGLDKLETFFSLPPAVYEMGPPERPGYIVMTSGTLAQPRPVLHAHRAIWARQMMWHDWEGLAASDRMLHAGAFNWTYTLGTGLLDPWTIGASAIVPGDGIAAEHLPQLAQNHCASIFAAAPGVFRKILRDRPDFGPQLRHALSAGEKLPEVTRRKWQNLTGTHIYEAFGMSECSTFISGAPGRPPENGALGWPQRGRQIALMQNGRKVAPGSIGEIAIHRDDPGLMLGYLGDAEKQARYDGAYFLTGDMGREDDTGAIHYLGRNDDILNAGGFRVSPAEIEHAMGMLDGVADCAAVDMGVAADTTIIALFYTGAPLSKETLAAHARQHLAHYKQPRAYFHRDDLPRGPNNKISRRRLRDMASRGMDDR